MSTTTSARRAHHGAPVHDHEVEGNGNGCLIAMHNHAEAVAHEQEIAIAVGDRGRVRVIGGEGDDRLTALHRRNIGRHQALLGAVNRHEREDTLFMDWRRGNLVILGPANQWRGCRGLQSIFERSSFSAPC
jgi:hypothetical protein